MKTKTMMAAAAAAATLLAGGAASATTDLMIVRVSDLDVQTEGGARAALRRIRAAAGEFCAPDNRWHGPVPRSGRDACENRMTDKAVEALDAPRVRHLHQPARARQMALGDRPAR